VILHIAATARYLLLKSQELHEVLMTVHETIGLYREEKVRQQRAYCKCTLFLLDS